MSNIDVDALRAGGVRVIAPPNIVVAAPPPAVPATPPPPPSPPTPPPAPAPPTDALVPPGTVHPPPSLPGVVYLPAPPAVVDAPPAPPPPPAAGDGTPPQPPDDSLDDEPDAEAGDAPTDDDYRQLEAEAESIDSGELQELAITHPTPGTLIGLPYEGTHARAFNRAGGSDNWQSENAVDVWLYPGTAILAVASGTISPGGYGYGLSALGGRFAGWRLHLITADGKAFFYTHLASLAAAQGQHVVAGEIIGRSGIANGVPHLHFAARPPFDPRSFYKAAFSIKDRSAIAPPVIGGVAVDVPPSAAQVDTVDVAAAWHELVSVPGLTLPAATAHLHDARQSLGSSVS